MTFKLMNQKQVAAALDVLVLTGKEIKQQISVLAVNAIGYSIVHNDIRIANRLLDHWPDGMRKQSLVNFLEKHGQLSWDKEQEKFAFRKVEDIEFNADKLLALDWTKAAAAEKVSSMFDAEDMVEKLIAKLVKAQKDKKEVVNASLVEYLRDAHAAWRAASKEGIIADDEESTSAEPAVSTAADAANAAQDDLKQAA